MDGWPKPKSKIFRKQPCSESRYFVNTWLEKELPQIIGDVINISAGGSLLPKQLLTNPGLKSYKTFDQKFYGDVKNQVDFYGDVQSMPKEWSNKWDCALCIEAFECYANPHKAAEEIRRILKPGGILIASSPWAYVWFGYGSNPESLKKKNPVKDYWRISPDGWKLLLKDFSKVEVNGFGGERDNDRFVYCVKAIK